MDSLPLCTGTLPKGFSLLMLQKIWIQTPARMLLRLKPRVSAISWCKVVTIFRAIFTAMTCLIQQQHLLQFCICLTHTHTSDQVQFECRIILQSGFLSVSERRLLMAAVRVAFMVLMPGCCSASVKNVRSTVTGRYHIRRHGVSFAHL